MPGDRTLDHIKRLNERVARLAFVLVNNARAAGYPVVITSSTRTLAEQRALVAAGRSRKLASLHLAGRAFDIDWAGVARERVPDWFWNDIGPYAERLGLRWGGRWRSPYDPGHFEL